MAFRVDDIYEVMSEEIGRIKSPVPVKSTPDGMRWDGFSLVVRAAYTEKERLTDRVRSRLWRNTPTGREKKQANGMRYRCSHQEQERARYKRWRRENAERYKLRMRVWRATRKAIGNPIVKSTLPRVVATWFKSLAITNDVN